MIWFNGFPFLDNKEDHTFNAPVSSAMTPATTLSALPVSGLSIADVEALLSNTRYSGFPIVDDAATLTLLGYIGRTELRYALDRARRDQLAPASAKCYFEPLAGVSSITPTTPAPAVTFDAIPETSGQNSVDLSKFVDATPISVHPRLPLETVMELFKKLGPKVILVEYRGRLTGLITVKDCLKYQFQAEAHENPRDDAPLREAQERLWGVLKWAGGRISVPLPGFLVNLVGANDSGAVRLNSSQGVDGRDNELFVSDEGRVATGMSSANSPLGEVELSDRLGTGFEGRPRSRSRSPANGP